jgi:outer membrane protein
MKKLLCVFYSLFIFSYPICPAIAEPESTSKIFNIAIVADGYWERNAEYFDFLKKEVIDVVGKQAQIVFPPDKTLEGDWTLQGVRRINDRLLEDPNVDLILGMGLMASQDLCTRGDPAKPVIAPIVIDPAGQHIPFINGTSGVKNLNYLVYPITFERDIKLFREIIPFKKLVNISSKRYYQVLYPSSEEAHKAPRRDNIDVVYLFFDSSADEVLKAIPGDADAVYLEPNLHLPPSEFKKLVQGFIDRQLPSFSFLGESEVRQGIMATANSDVFTRLLRRTALNIQRIVQGAEPGTISVAFSPGKKLFINLHTAYAVGVTPNWNTLLEAEMVQVDTTSTFAERLSLPYVIQRTLEANLDIQAKLREVAAEAKNVALARSSLLPKMDFSATGLKIDRDRAQASYQPEQSGTGELSLTQVIFSEPAVANLSIQSSLYKSKKDELELTRLDNVVAGASTYLNYLRAQKIYFILLDNLKITRSNLELAQIRQTTGVAGPEEPLRWEVEIANMRKTVMGLHSQMNEVRYLLNFTLNFHLNQELSVTDVSLTDPTMFISDEHVQGYLQNPIGFDRLTEYLVKTGLSRSYELQQIEALIAAQKRALTSSRNSFFMPTIAAYANYGNNFYKSGQVTPFALTTIPQPPEGLDPRVPLYLGQLLSAASPKLPDRKSWSVGAQLSFTIFNGFSKLTTEQKTSQQLEQLHVRYKEVTERVAMRIRSEMQNAKSSYFAIQQTELQRDAAHKMLDLTTDAYSRGAVSILNLLDAQNAALQTDLMAANALYDFLIQYVQLQRSLGKFDILMTVDERNQFLAELILFMDRARKY